MRSTPDPKAPIGLQTPLLAGSPPDRRSFAFFVLAAALVTWLPVTAIVVGTRVSFPNRDKVQHHVYSLSKPKRFELPLYRGESKEPVLFDQPGVVTLGCNIHDWMSAHIAVLATPYFARSGADGLVPLQNLPPGRYRLDVWHPRMAAPVMRDVVITATDAATQVISVTLRPDRRIRRAPEGSDGGYK